MSSSQPRLINQRYALAPTPRSGGMADVYKATDMLDNLRQVAVKIFKHGTLEEDVLKEAFRRETNALKELKHPHIVELLDTGIDEETGHYFLVLEWMERNLQDVIKETPPGGWDEFAEAIALPLLDALAFAHSRNFIHRDIKPSNILVNENNVPKLADFSISKFKRWLQPGLTLMEFVSRPYSPPEPDDGSYTYTRDVFGLGVLVLDALTDVDLFEYEDIDKALKDFDAPDEIISAIASSVSFDPLERQTNAADLKSKIEKIQSRREAEWIEKKPCYLRPIAKGFRRLQEELDLPSSEELDQTLLEDLNTECGISPYKDQNKDVPGHYFISGVNFGYHVAVDNDSADHLVVLSVRKLPNSRLEISREFSWVPPYEFRFGRPLSKTEGIQIVVELQQKVDEFQSDLEEKQLEEREQYLFRIWGDILRAKSDAEKDKEAPLEYKRTTVKGKRIRFYLTQIPEDDLVGQPRQVNLPNRAYVSGEVEDVTGDELTLVVDYGDPTTIPSRGHLVFDTYAARIALERQKAALDAVRYDRSARSDLRHLLNHAEDIKKPTTKDVEFLQDLDIAKREAVRAALGAEDFLLVEGPPGTGKTTFIAEVILQTLLQNPDARILLSSQTHVALDNGLERVYELMSGLKMARIGRIDDARISPEMSKLLLENQMDSWSIDVFASGDDYLKNWATKKGIPAYEVELAIKLEELSFVRKVNGNLESELQKLQSRLGEDDELRNLRGGVRVILPDEEVTRLKEDISRLQSRLRENKKEEKNLQDELHERGEIEAELAQSSAEELDDWAQHLLPDEQEAHVFKHLLNIHAEWQKRFGKDPEFYTALLARSQVIAGTCIGIAGIKGIQDLDFDLCIIDEASKATATEMLVPMSRSKRWILVGDPNQLPPFEGEISHKPYLASKYDLDIQDIKRTLFDHLLEILPEECKKILSIQHRMVAPIGDLISECFYDGRLESAKKDIDDSLQIVLPKPVTWFSSSSIDRHQEMRTGLSFTNPCEAEIIRQLLKRLNFILEQKQKHYTVAVLTGYSSQRMVLDRAILSEKHNWEYLEVNVNTVDAFQGREADIALYTVTRSNEEGNIGFLRELERLNVALSRGKVGLIVVGDAVFCRTSRGDNPLKKVIDYIERHPENCVIEPFVLESN